MSSAKRPSLRALSLVSRVFHSVRRSSWKSSWRCNREAVVLSKEARMVSGWPDEEPLGQWQESLFWKVPPLAWPEFHLYDNPVSQPLSETASRGAGPPGLVTEIAIFSSRTAPKGHTLGLLFIGKCPGCFQRKLPSQFGVGFCAESTTGIEPGTFAGSKRNPSCSRKAMERTGPVTAPLLPNPRPIHSELHNRPPRG
jgi:hypothetical protein